MVEEDFSSNLLAKLNALNAVTQQGCSSKILKVINWRCYITQVDQCAVHKMVVKILYLISFLTQQSNRYLVC